MTVASAHCGLWLRPKVEGIGPPGRGGHACAAVGDKVLIFGGADRAATPFDDLFALELGTGGHYTWTRVKAHLQAGLRLTSRTGATLTVIGTDVFMFGGQEPASGLCFSDVLKLDTDTWSWSKVATSSGSPPPRHGHCAGRLRENCILVYGGASQSNSVFGDVWVFNTVSGAWTRIEVAGTAPAPREMAAAVMLDDKRMLVTGGRSSGHSGLDPLADVAVLDMARCAWRPHAPLSVPHCAHSAALLPRSSFSDALLQHLRRHQNATEPTAGSNVIPQDQDRLTSSAGASVSAEDAPVAVLFGGFTGDAVADGITLLDTASMQSVPLGGAANGHNASAPRARFAHTAAVIPSIRGSGKKAMLIFGGVSPSEEYSDVCAWYPC